VIRPHPAPARYVDAAHLSEGLKQRIRTAILSSALLVPTGFFLSVLTPETTVPNQLIYFASIGAVVLVIGLLVLVVHQCDFDRM
jgi:hypothetical protein